MGKPKMSIIVPTRGRPDGSKILMDSVLDTATDPDAVEILFYVDNDDPRVDDYRNLKTSGIHRTVESVKIFIGPPKIGFTSSHVLCENALGDLVIMSNDDVIYRTQGWDKIITYHRQIYPDDIFIMYCDDTIDSPKLAVFPILTKRWRDVIGYYYPPMFTFLYQDTWVADIAKRLDRLYYVPEVVMEHKHVGYKGIKSDDTYKRNIVNRERKMDREIYIRSEGMREVAAQLLRKAISEYRSPGLRELCL